MSVGTKLADQSLDAKDILENPKVLDDLMGYILIYSSSSDQGKADKNDFANCLKILFSLGWQVINITGDLQCLYALAYR